MIEFKKNLIFENYPLSIIDPQKNTEIEFH